jgi:hypothetical protein
VAAASSRRVSERQGRLDSRWLRSPAVKENVAGQMVERLVNSP